eukprot:gene11203-3259_t
MTSLNSAFSQQSSTIWCSPSSGEEFPSSMRVWHVAIRAPVHVEDKHGRHVKYKIEVMTKTFRWLVFHRYSDFVHLHKQLMKLFNFKHDMLPSKRISGNFSSSLIKERQYCLQRYLQRLINSQPDVIFSKPLLHFLEVLKHDVVAVTGKLSKYFHLHSQKVISRHKPIKLTPNQCRCIAKRRHLPMDAQVFLPAITEPLDVYGHPSYLPDLFETCHRLTQLVITPRQLKGAREPEMYTDDSFVDLNLFPSLTELESRSPHLKVSTLTKPLISQIAAHI